MKRTSAWLSLLCFAIVPASTQAQDLTQAFPQRSHDFGTVARGSKVRHSFPIVNNTDSEIEIANVRTKCGCTEYKLGSKVIPPGTQTTVEAVLDTTKFQGYKASGLTLILSRPYATEVDLNLTSFIRTDLVTNPGSVDFGVVNRSGEPKVTIRVSYAGGRPDWAITKMQTVSANVVARAVELSRSPGGQVEYELTATLKPGAIEPGNFKDEITLITNDQATPNFPISVAANVQSAVSVSPAILSLGRVKVGDTVKKTVLVRSGKPFKVLEMTGEEGSGFEAQIDPNSDPRPLHQIPVTFKVPDKPGPYHATLEFKTDVQGDPVAKLSTFATVER